MDASETRVALLEQSVTSIQSDLCDVSQNINKISQCMSQMAENVARLEAVLVTNKEFSNALLDVIRSNSETNGHIERIESAIETKDKLFTYALSIMGLLVAGIGAYVAFLN